MIKNPDGTAFALKASLANFDPDDPGHNLFNSFDEEIIKIGGSSLMYYSLFIQDQTIDPVYLEDRGKIFSNYPVLLYGYYEPPDQSNPSGMFGIDTPDEETIFEMNYHAVIRDVGHMPKRGSRIYTPHRQENWIIIDTKLGEFKMWGILHLKLHCRKFQETSTTGEGSVSQPRQDFVIDN